MNLRDEMLLVVCVNDTPENTRNEVTDPCINSMLNTVELDRHKLVLVDNGSTDPRTIALLDRVSKHRGVELIRLPENKYATYAYNVAIKRYDPAGNNQIFVRIENDVVFQTDDWAEIIWETFDAAHKKDFPLGLLSTLPVNLPKGWERVHVLEGADGPIILLEAGEVPGYTTAFHPDLLRSLGYLQSAGRYIEDVITSDRALTAGYRLGYISRENVLALHIDTVEGRPAYQKWKSDVAREEWDVMVRLRHAYRRGGDVFVPFEE